MRVLSQFDIPIGWGELVKRTARETSADNGLGLAAQLAYYFFLALFPALLFFIALASFFASEGVINQLVGSLSGVAPAAVVDIIRQQLTDLANSDSGGLLTFGIAAALWSSSAAMVGLIDALNRAYDVEDARPWWKQRLIAILLTIGVAIFVLVSITLVVSGPELARYIAQQVDLGDAFTWTWMVLQWPVVFILIATAVGLIYYFAPNVDQDFLWITPGSVLATALWLIGSLGFRFYVVNFGSYNATYGAIGGVMVLMLWLYITGLVIIVGAEMNAEIEHASPYGKDPGEKVAGEKKKIGMAAWRHWRERKKKGEPVGPPPEPPRPAAPPPNLAPARPGEMVLGGIIAGALEFIRGRRRVKD
jgi:membrane protein